MKSAECYLIFGDYIVKFDLQVCFFFFWEWQPLSDCERLNLISQWIWWPLFPDLVKINKTAKMEN